MTKSQNRLVAIDPRDIKFIIHRDRDPAQFQHLKEAIRAIGVRQPLQVRDISSWKPDQRRRQDGGTYKWEALFGEGRTRAVLELLEETGDPQWKRVPAVIEDVPQGEILSRFLSENLLRRDLSWVERANLVLSDVNAGLSPKELSERYFISAAHIERLLKVLNRTNPKLMDALKDLTIQEAEALVKLPKASQEIVMEALNESGLPGSNIPAVVHMAQEQAASGQKLSKSALTGSIQRLQEAVKKQRPKVKLAQQHFRIGPMIYGEHILKDKTFTAMLDKRKINWKSFMEAYKK